jgi:hypothetical protein
MDVLPMTVTSRLLEAYLKCTTKCFLRSLGETYEGNPYANWVDNQNRSYRNGALDRLKNGVPIRDRAGSPTSAEGPVVAPKAATPGTFTKETRPPGAAPHPKDEIWAK